MTGSVEFPAMRAQVVSAVRALADRSYQDANWGHVEPGVNFYDDLTLNVHILYDDCAVLPDPAARLGVVLLPGDLDVLVHLHDALGPMLADLGNSPDDSYLADPRWDSVLEAAQAALAAMTSSD